MRPLPLFDGPLCQPSPSRPCQPSPNRASVALPNLAPSRPAEPLAASLATHASPSISFVGSLSRFFLAITASRNNKSAISATVRCSCCAYSAIASRTAGNVRRLRTTVFLVVFFGRPSADIKIAFFVSFCNFCRQSPRQSLYCLHRGGIVQPQNVEICWETWRWRRKRKSRRKFRLSRSSGA